jgi:hypothetical protein
MEDTMPGTRAFLVVFPTVLLGVVVVSCGDETPAQPSCSYSIAASKQAFAATGGTGTAVVSTGATCSWIAASESSWVSFSGNASGTGSGAVQYVVAANGATATRKARLTVAGQPIDIDQEGRAPCTYAIAPSGQEFPAVGGAGSIAITAGEGCEWNASVTVAWVTFASGASGSGNGTVTFTVSSNTTVDDRNATITVAGQSVSLRQAGTPAAPPVACEYSVSPVEVIDHWHSTGFQLSVSTSSGCDWTASASEPWLTVSRSSGQGSGSIAVSYSQFTEEGTRRAAVQVRWPTPTAGENVWVTQEGCRYGFDTTPASLPASGGTRQVTVVTQAVSPSCSIGCPWSATSNASWIHVTSSMPRAGDDAFSFSVDANIGGARVGTITIAGRTYTVNQAGS